MLLPRITCDPRPHPAGPRSSRTEANHPPRHAGATGQPSLRASAVEPEQWLGFRLVAPGKPQGAQYEPERPCLGILELRAVALERVVPDFWPDPAAFALRCCARWDRLCWRAAVRPVRAADSPLPRRAVCGRSCPGHSLPR